MSDTEARDAYVKVAVKLPTGKELVGRPVMYPDAMRFMAMSDDYATHGGDLKALIAEFHQVTGIPTDDPVIAEVTLGEFLDAMNQYFYQRRRIPVQATSPATPTPTPSV